MTDIVERLLAPAYWMSGSSEGHEGENSAPLEAAAEITRLRAALLDAGASLAAAISLLERGGKKAAASDKMFAIMLDDYKKSLDRARAALEGRDG